MNLLCFLSLFASSILPTRTGLKQRKVISLQRDNSATEWLFREFFLLKNFPAHFYLLLSGSVLLTACSLNTPDKIRLMHQKRKVMLAAHRGASGVAPENTLTSIQKALDSPADFIEIDVHQTLDSQLVLMHDATVDRTTNGEGAIAKMSLAEIKKLDAGSWFKPEFKKERVPTLEEALKLIKGRKKILIELKKGRDFYPSMVKQTVTLIQKYQARDWCVIQSFHDEILQQVWQNEYSVFTHKLIVGKLPMLPVYFDTGLRFGSFDKYYRASAINVHRYFATRGFVKLVHNAGFKTFVWTTDDPSEINKLVEREVDGIISNATASLVIE